MKIEKWMRKILKIQDIEPRSKKRHCSTRHCVKQWFSIWGNSLKRMNGGDSEGEYECDLYYKSNPICNLNNYFENNNTEKTEPVGSRLRCWKTCMHRERYEADLIDHK